MAEDVLLVVPAWREFHRLPPYLKELMSALSGARFPSRILVVDDGSPPDEQQRLLGAMTPGTFGACTILEPLLSNVNHGKGYSIRQGWRSGGSAGWYAFVDADGAIPASEVFRLLDLATSATKRATCLWGSRVRMLGRHTDRKLSRFLLGRIFANLVSYFIELPVYDTQCGFKIVPGIFYQKIAGLLQEERFCFDIELLLALHHGGAPIEECPIDWRDVPGGHVDAFRDGFAMLARLPAILSRARNWPAMRA
jgi:glycosyltransferase involved in cell wall biosynthesis